MGKKLFRAWVAAVLEDNTLILGSAPPITPPEGAIQGAGIRGADFGIQTRSWAHTHPSVLGAPLSRRFLLLDLWTSPSLGGGSAF